MTTLWQNSTYGYQCTRIKDYLSIPRQHPSVKPIFRKIRVNLNEPFNILTTNPVKLHLVESKFYFLQKGRRNRGLVSMAVKASISYRFANCYYRHDLWCSNKGWTSLTFGFRGGEGGGGGIKWDQWSEMASTVNMYFSIQKVVADQSPRNVNGFQFSFTLSPQLLNCQMNLIS